MANDETRFVISNSCAAMSLLKATGSKPSNTTALVTTAGFDGAIVGVKDGLDGALLEVSVGAILAGAPISAALGELLGAGDGALLGGGVPPRHASGTDPRFIIPVLSSTPHPFRPVAPTLSRSLCDSQLDTGQPSWQYPHGTKSHDAQLPGNEKVGAVVGESVGAPLTDVLVLGASVDALFGCVSLVG